MNTQAFTIQGMHCLACTKLTAKRINQIEDVTEATVDLETHTATLKATRRIHADEINDMLSDSDYRAEERHDEDS